MFRPDVQGMYPLHRAVALGNAGGILFVFTSLLRFTIPSLTLHPSLVLIAVELLLGALSSEASSGSERRRGSGRGTGEKVGSGSQAGSYELAADRINQRDEKWGWTPLFHCVHIPSARKRGDIAHRLLEEGADIWM